jgi:hypothetical protein
MAKRTEGSLGGLGMTEERSGPPQKAAPSRARGTHMNVRPPKEEEGEFGVILSFGCVYGTTEVVPSQSKKRQAIKGRRRGRGRGGAS